MATRDGPLEPPEVLAAAEAAHLATRRTVPISRVAAGHRPDAGAAADPGRHADADPTWEPDPGDRPDPDGPDPGHRADAELAPEPGPDGAESGHRAEAELAREPDPGSRADPSRPGPGTAAPARRAPLVVAAGFAASWAALVSLGPVAVLFVVLYAAEHGSVAVWGPARAAGAGWLLAHGVPLQTSTGPVALAPLVLTLLAAWRLARAGVHVTRAVGRKSSGGLGRAAAAVAAVALAYGGIGAAVGTVAGGAGWGASPLRAGLTLTGFGLVAAGYGSLHATGRWQRWAHRVPPTLRVGARTGLVTALGLLGAGAAVAGTAIAAGGGAAADVIARYDTSVAGQAGLTLVCLAYAPNVATWAAAYLLGPGFSVGADTMVRSSEVSVGLLPPLPTFAGVPDGPLPTAGAVLLLVPIVAAAVAGIPLARRAPGLGRLLLGAVVTGVVAGGLLGLVAAGSGGSLGDGRFATLGPDPLAVGVFSATTVTVGALLGAAAAAVLSHWRRP